MDPRSTVAQYPRNDRAYQAKSSLDFDSFKTKIYADKVLTWRQHFAKWCAMLLAGVCMGTIAFLMTILEDHLNLWRAVYANTLISKYDFLPDHPEYYGLMLGYFYFMIFGVVLILISCLLTIYVAPAAAGSGVAEIIAMLNGINYPGIIAPETCFVKALGVVLAVVGGLCIGEEGPLVHIGAIVAVMVIYLPIEAFQEFQNDHERRLFVAAGAAAGVSAAFGAPIGGTLFAYEISTPNTFWNFSMLWKVFLCAGASTFTLAILDSLSNGDPVTLAVAGTLKFGTLIQTDIPIQEIVAAISIGIICGLLGALFVTITTYLGIKRKKYIKENWQRLVEIAFFGIATNTAFYWGPAIFDKCYPIPGFKVRETYYQYTCADGEYNPLANLMFNTEGGAIHALLSVTKTHIHLGAISYYFFVWYFFTVTTYGVFVPAGLFLPGMIMGCALGIIYGEVVDTFVEGNHHHQTNQIMGAAAMLAGYTRFTYSLAVIMLETTSSINLFIPIIVTISTSFQVGQAFNQSLYERSLRAKQLPVLRESVPVECRNVRAGQIMSKHLQCAEGVAKVRDIVCLIRDTQYGAFPVVNIAGNVVGMIPRNFLFVLIENHCFYNAKEQGVKAGKVSFHYTAISSFYDKNRPAYLKPFEMDDGQPRLSERSSLDSKTAAKQANSKSSKIQDATSQSLETPFLDRQVSQPLANSDYQTMKINESQPKTAEQLDSAEAIEFGQTQVEPVEETPLEQQMRQSMNSDATVVQDKRKAQLNMMHLSAFQQRARIERSKSAERDYEAVEMFTADLDTEYVPLESNRISWEAFNAPFYSHDRQYDEVRSICEDNMHQRIDLRPYMVECPYQVFTTDKLQKVLSIFRHMHLRHLLVTNPTDGKFVGIITRQDIFAYMSL